MAEFTICSLEEGDGTWAAFEANWQAQCAEAGEDYSDYAPNSVDVLRGIVDGRVPPVGPPDRVGVTGLRCEEDGHFYAACMLNLVRLPRFTGMTLRVRHVIVSPLLDFGIADTNLYADVLINLVGGVIHVSESVFEANNLHFHLRSPADIDFFRAFGKALDGADVFRSVQTHGAWLHIAKT